MGNKIEIRFSSIQGARENSYALGRAVAQKALLKIKVFAPSLVLVFAAIKYDFQEMLKGIRMVTGKIPLIGTSTAGEIADKFQENSIVLLILASPYLRAQIGVGERVSQFPEQAVAEAIKSSDLERYLNWKLNWDKEGGFQLKKQNEILAIVFSPGSTKEIPSPSQIILNVLKIKTQNRLPVFGGSSADSLTFEKNYQLANDKVLNDAFVLCVIETELRFGLAVDHGFTPTDRKTTVTKAEGHKVITFDRRPAAEVYAEMTRKTVDELKKLHEQLTLYTRTPLGQSTDFGEYVLKVPDFILEDNSIVFTPLVFENTVFTLMEGTREKTLAAAGNAVEKAIFRGKIENPALVLLFPCVLRRILFEDEARLEVEMVKKKVQKSPVIGFYTYGEQNMSDDNVLTYYNETASVLVLGNELNDVSRANRENEVLYARLQKTIKKLEQANQEIRNKVDELAIARDHAQDSDRLKSEFIATMSHELRTPLNSILGFIGIILKGIPGELNDEQKKQLNMVYSSAKHLLNLINDILDLSRIESGKMKVSIDKFRIEDVVSQVEQLLKSMLDQKKLKFVSEIQEGIPELRNDRKKIFQIILNLANNAVKFTSQGQIKIQCSATDDTLTVKVSDTGIGIKQEDLSTLFEAFRQIDGTAQRRYQGAGLGLYLCKKLLALLGGDIQANSIYGKGATFSFNVPLKLDEGIKI